MVGRNGGLMVLWKNDVDFTIKHFSKHHGEIKMGRDGDQSKSWFLTRAYGHPDAFRRDKI